jgi:hypothetical protein
MGNPIVRNATLAHNAYTDRKTPLSPIEAILQELVSGEAQGGL